MFRSPPGTNRRQGGVHLPMTEGDQRDERREGYEEEELPPDPPGNPRPPAADTVTLESILAIVQDFRTEIRTKFERLEARLDEHEAQLHHLNANYVRTTSPPDLIPNRPRLLKILDVVSNPCLPKTPDETLISFRPRQEKISTVDFPRTTGTVRVCYLLLNRHVNLSETINEDTRIQIANSNSPNSHSHSDPSIRTRTSIVKEQHHRKACLRHVHQHSGPGRCLPNTTPPMAEQRCLRDERTSRPQSSAAWTWKGSRIGFGRWKHTSEPVESQRKNISTMRYSPSQVTQTISSTPLS